MAAPSLWVAKQLVEKHGGSMSLESATEGQQRGTTFSVVLPATAGAGDTRDGNDPLPPGKGHSE